MHGIILSWLLLWSVSCALLPTTVFAQRTGAIEGQVRDASGTPLADVRIVVERTELATRSAANGSFRLPEVPAGRQTLTTLRSGYQPLSRAVEVRAGAVLHLEVVLSVNAIELREITVVGVRGTPGYLADHSRSGKLDAPLLRTPQSTSVITPARMEAQGAETQAEALRYTAGIQPEPFGPDILYDWMQIRGFQQYGQNLYRDGLQLRSASQATLRLNPYGAERIELLRGPASVLHGQASAGGFLNYVSKTPQAESYQEIELQGGSFERLQGAADLTGPITDGATLRYRLTGLARTAEAQEQFSKDKHIFVAPALTWAPTPTTTLTVMGDYQRDDAVRGTSFLPAEGTVLPNPNGTIPVDREDGIPGFDGFERNQYSVSYRFEHAFAGGWSVRSTARYTGMDNDYQIAWGAGLQNDQRTLNRFWFSGVPTLDIVAVDNHGIARFSSGGLQHTVLVGVDLQRHVLDERFDIGPAPPLDVFDPEYNAAPRGDAFFSADTRRVQRQIGLYLQETVEIGGWTLVLSGRRDWTKSETLDRTTDATTEQRNGAFTGRIGVVHAFASGLAPYASYSESFLPLLGTGAEGDAFDPERGRQVEVGVKYQPSGANAFVTVAAFDLRRQNVLTPDPDNVTFQTQSGEIRSRGVEFEGVARLGGLDVTAAYTFLDVRVTASNAGDQGQRPIIVPAHAASLWADYTLQDGRLAGLGFGGGVRHTGATFGDAANTLKIPAYTLVDVAAHYDWGRFRLAASASNLLDETYVASCFTAAACFYGSVRTVRATLRYTP